MEADDFDAVVGIDAKIVEAARPEYYEIKFEKLFRSQDFLPTSLVALRGDGMVVGFVMGQIYMGEYGIFQEEASLDTISIDPEFQHEGIGARLVDEFMDHLRELGVKKVNTLVARSDTRLIKSSTPTSFVPRTPSTWSDRSEPFGGDHLQQSTSHCLESGRAGGGPRASP